jgi:hypothetical protein
VILRGISPPTQEQVRPIRSAPVGFTSKLLKLAAWPSPACWEFAYQRLIGELHRQATDPVSWTLTLMLESCSISADTSVTSQPFIHCGDADGELWAGLIQFLAL